MIIFNSIDANSSAGVFRGISPGLSDAGLPNEGPTAPVNRSRTYLESVQDWMNEVIDSNAVMEPVDEPAHPGPQPALNVEPHPPFHGGEWLAPEDD